MVVGTSCFSLASISGHVFPMVTKMYFYILKKCYNSHSWTVKKADNQQGVKRIWSMNNFLNIFLRPWAKRSRTIIQPVIRGARHKVLIPVRRAHRSQSTLSRDSTRFWAIKSPAKPRLPAVIIFVRSGLRSIDFWYARSILKNELYCRVNTNSFFRIIQVLLHQVNWLQ